MKLLPLVILLGTFALAGCSTVPKYENEQKPGDAMMRVEKPEFGKVMTGEVMMSLELIDSRPTPFMKNGVVYFLRPGKHELALTVGSDLFFKIGRQFLEADFVSNHKYLLKPTYPDNDYLVELIDETDPKTPATVTKVKVRAGSTHIFPVPIPVK